MSQTAIGIVGAGGRMGRMLVQAVDNHPDAILQAASERYGSDLIGQDVGTLAGIGSNGVLLVDSPQTVFTADRVVIDFTVPSATLEHVKLAQENNSPMVIGTTGIDADGVAQLAKAAKSIPIVFAPNFSVGVNLMFKIAAEVAKALDGSADFEIIEAHHKKKVDAPSGTALGLGEAIAAAVGRNLAEVGVFAREGHTGVRDDKAIGFSTIRGGDIVGDHTAMFIGEDESLEITHRAKSRMIFANGAVRAALWVADKEPGMYDMGDILGLK
ncbi:MAG: 4-hydroxy-tetrahydrodipicolinate reductase [Magnetococcales bacterium]|nr:4-hydroxy-tetrahydrodipicolinate reductase [Magnetococcales bacterium]